MSATPPYGSTIASSRESPGDHVHPEVPAPQIVLERDVRAGFDLELLMADAGRALAARQRDVALRRPDAGTSGRRTTRRRDRRGPTPRRRVEQRVRRRSRSRRSPGLSAAARRRRARRAELVAHATADGDRPRPAEGAPSERHRADGAQGAIISSRPRRVSSSDKLERCFTMNNPLPYRVDSRGDAPGESACSTINIALQCRVGSAGASLSRNNRSCDRLAVNRGRPKRCAGAPRPSGQPSRAAVSPGRRSCAGIAGSSAALLEDQMRRSPSSGRSSIDSAPRTSAASATALRSSVQRAALQQAPGRRARETGRSAPRRTARTRRPAPSRSEASRDRPDRGRRLRRARRATSPSSPSAATARCEEHAPAS